MKKVLRTVAVVAPCLEPGVNRMHVSRRLGYLGSCCCQPLQGGLPTAFRRVDCFLRACCFSLHDSTNPSDFSPSSIRRSLFSQLNHSPTNLMAVEVIDLLSSPEAAPSRTRPQVLSSFTNLREKSEAAVAVQQAWGWPEPKPKPKPVKPASGDDDLFDLTDPTVLQSFQSPTPPVMPRGTAPVQKPTISKASRADDFLFLSDDFDTTVDVSEVPSEPRPTKKPRVEPDTSAGTRNKIDIGSSNRALQRPLSRPIDGPAIAWQATSTRKWNTTLDPIQTSSDPFASSPHEAPKVKAGPTFIDLSKDDEDDHLASSPHVDKGKGRELSTKLDTRPPLSSPMFTSSPLLPDLGDVPPENPKPQSKAKDPLAWDHISSSAPETGNQDDWLLDERPTSGRNGLKRSRSDIKDLNVGISAHVSWSSDDDSLPDIDDIRPLKYTAGREKSTGAAKRTTTSKKSEAEKELEKLEKAAAREAEKRRKQKEKEHAKEEKKREKERAAALAEVNKVRTDKKVSTPEMIVDLPTSLSPSVKLQIETLLGDLRVKCHSYSSPVKDVVKWRRKVKARFNEDEGHWEPIPERIEQEKHAMVILQAAEFVELALGPKGSDLEAHTLKLQLNYRHHALIYLIEGLEPWMRKNRNVRNRQFQAAVHSVGAQADPTVADDAAPPSSAQRSRQKNPKPPALYIDEDTVEDALLQLQVLHGALIHHTKTPVETAQWVTIFTQHISTIPYRKQKDAANASAAFCMDSGQVRTGDGAQDTYVRMLQEIVRVTPPIAVGICSEFPTVMKLLEGFQRQGPLALEGINKAANRDGAFTDRKVGQAISRRVHKVFTGMDEGSTDI